MAKILCVSSGMTSVVYPALELSRRLAAAGHQVVFAGSPERRGLVERLGLAFVALCPGRLDDVLEADAQDGFLPRLRSLALRRRQAVEALGADTFAQELRRLDPDLVLIDGEMHEHIVVTLGAGVRLALLNAFVSIWRRPGLPPPHTMVRPGVGWGGTRLGMALSWRAFLLKKGWRRLQQWKQHVGCDRVSRLLALAAAQGVDLSRARDTSQWLMPFTYRSLPVLSLHARELEFPHSPPGQVRYVGPMVLRARPDLLSGADRQRLDARLSDRKRRLIYAAFGSTLTAGVDFLRRLIRVVEQEDWDLVLSLGRRLDAAALGPLPEGVHVFPWLPQLEVLEHADIAITHGGINTLDECVLAGVPVLVYCGFETDMAGNTARVVHHGLGSAGDPADDTADIRRKVRSLLGDADYGMRAIRFRLRYRVYEASKTLENAVEDLLRDRLQDRLRDQSDTS